MRWMSDWWRVAAARRLACCAAVLVVGIGATGCQSSLSVLRDSMTGSFSSAAQHQAEPDTFFDIRLEVVEIWLDRDDGPWLYVEQAAASRLESPYRQRIYHLQSHPDGTLSSTVYELPGDPLRFAGAWREPQRFAALSPSDLEERIGCVITLRRQLDGRFVGSTSGKECRSTLRGATYATSEVEITENLLLSWDRGFDADDAQVWGATEGGYRFARVE